MKRFTAETWEPIGNSFIRGENVLAGEPLWQGHTRVSWLEAEAFLPHSRIDISRLIPECEGEAIVTAVTSANQIFEGETGVWIDFHGVGPLGIDGDTVEFVQEREQTR